MHFLQSNAEKLELSINVWKKKDAANHSWFEWSIVHFLQSNAEKLELSINVWTKKWCSKLALTWMIYSTCFQSYIEKFYLNSSAECRGGDALTSHEYKLSKQQDQLHLVFRWWNCNLRERQHWTLQRDKIAFLIDLMEKSVKKIKNKIDFLSF